MAIEISKGSVLRDVVPYAVVPLYGSNDGAPNDDDVDASDPTRVAALERLPRWTPCRIWEGRRRGRGRDDRILQTSRMTNYLRKARRTASASSSEDAIASWHVLCLLTLLRVVADNVCDDPSTDDERPSGGDAPSQWWSPLVSERCDDEEEEEGQMPSDDDDDDDDDDVGASLLVELWPLIRDCIPWPACLRLHRRIRSRLHVLKIEHPLTTWARTTLFHLTDEEFRTGWNLVEGAAESADVGAGTPDECEAAEPSSSPPNRLAASKLLSDRVADLPARLVGVLIDDPLGSLAGGKDVARGGGGEGGGEQAGTTSRGAALSLPRRHQSRLPNTCLELHVANDATDVRGEQSLGEIRCRWIALYDLSSDESKETNRTLSTMPNFGGRGRSTTPSSGEYVEGSEIDAANLAQARRSAHSHFRRGEFRDAMSLYRRCFRFCASSNERREESDGRSAESKGGRECDRAEADLWHAVGAVLLSRGRFARAQRHWRDGGRRYRDVHEELAGQLEKQDAYRYFHPQPKVEIRKCSYEVVRPSKRRIARNPNDASGPTVYLSSDVIEADVCDDLIRWAKEHASCHGGWTASRHYAVPTTDLPVHRVPKLLRWFSEWAPRRLLPLLEDQFGSAECGGDGRDRRFYVHDAFLVRYEATASSHFLPLHFDESTHSCVLALNDDFEGGGSYMHGLDRSVAPRTGGMVSFLGDRCLHGGNPVTCGVRYILAIFLFRDEDLSRTPPGEASESNPLLPTERNEGKRRDETKQNESAFPKRPKKDGGLQSDGGGFSFSFF